MAAIKQAVQNILPSGTTNQAAWLDGTGQKLRVDKTEIPTPDADEVIVKNHAIAVNPVDWKIQDYPGFIKTWPFVAGEDIAGEIVQVGSNVTRFNKGDRVFSHVISLASQKPKNGGFQLYTAAPAVTTAIIPASISYNEASVLPLALDTAGHGLLAKDFFGLPFPSLNPTPSGKTVLVWGGSSSVGALAIQLAIAGGSKVITVASKRNHAFVKSLGASEALDYNDSNILEDAIKAIESVGGEFVGVYDAISNDASYKHTVPISEKTKVAFLATVLPPPENLPTGLKATQVFAIQPELLGPIWSDYVTPALEQGKLKAVPEALVIGKGLEHLQKGLDTSRAGVSAQKVVIEL